MTTPSPALLKRAENICELCSSDELLHLFEVPSEDASRSSGIAVCQACLAQLGEDATLDENHWYGLQGSIWSPHAAVQVMSWRLLRRLEGVAWAQELLTQAYLEEDVQQWASEGMTQDAEQGTPTFDSNGTRLSEGDAVTLIRDLDVKGASFTAKRGTLVKNIHLTGDPGNIEGRVNGIAIVLKTEFLKKA